jgi:glutamate dehydrogenase (NADP+)
MPSLDLATFTQGLIRRNPGEPEFHQAVEEVVASLIPFLRTHPKYVDAGILERMTEPDRVIMFRVCWLDDQNQIRTNRAYRVQFNNPSAPTKGDCGSTATSRCQS